MGRLNKKGSVMDLIWLTISVVLVAVSLLVLWQFWADMSGPLHESLGYESEEINASIASGDAVTASFDYMLLGGIVAIFIAMIVLAFMIPANPVFAIVYLIVMIVNVWLCAIFSRAYETFSTTPALVNASASMPMQNFIMMNLTSIMFMLGLMVMIITFAKPYIMGGGER